MCSKAFLLHFAAGQVFIALETITKNISVDNETVFSLQNSWYFTF